jgi:hypothetical protein
MSSSISSISSSTAQQIATSSCSNSQLSETTKKRLEALGIDPSTVQTEAQAQILITQAEAAKNQQNSSQQGGNSSEQQLMSEAKELATSVGVSVSSSDSLDDIIDKISDQIQVMLNSDDQSKVSMAQGYQTQLESISDRVSNVQTTQQNIFNSMDMISVSNKYALGL